MPSFDPLADPLPGPDSPAWTALLAKALAADGGYRPDGYVGTLRGLRALGARIRGTRLVPPVDMDSEELAATLGTRRVAVAGWLA